MNRAAWAARCFFAVALLPTVVAAGFAVYKFRTQPPPPAYRYGGWNSPQITAGLPGPHAGAAFLLGAYAPGKKFGGPDIRAPAGLRDKVAALGNSPRLLSDLAGLYGFEALVKLHATITVRNIAWDTKSTFPASYVAGAATLGAETVIELEPKGKSAPTLAQIAAGTPKVELWLTRFAKAARSVHDHFILSFAPEMNGYWYRKYGAYKSDQNTHGDCKDHGYTYRPGASPNDYIMAYRHVYDVLTRYFRIHGAPDLASFMWQPSAIHRNTLCPIPWWPGQHYVDEVGLDGYFYYRTDTFDSIFGKTLGYLRRVAPSTPVMIGETAVSPNIGPEKPYIKSLFSGISHNQLGGFIWFDDNQLLNPGVAQGFAHQNYLLRGGTPAARAFLAGLPPPNSIAAFSKTYVNEGGQKLIPIL